MSNRDMSENLGTTEGITCWLSAGDLMPYWVSDAEGAEITAFETKESMRCWVSGYVCRLETLPVKEVMPFDECPACGCGDLLRDSDPASSDDHCDIVRCEECDWEGMEFFTLTSRESEMVTI